MSRVRPIAFWLIPAQPWHRDLSSRIGRLAAEFASPAFEPHVTLHVDEAQADLGDLLGSISEQAHAIEMSAGATAHGPSRFKTLFIEFDDPRPAALQALIRTRLPTPSAYPLQPHLSLLYREALGEQDRQRLAAMHDFRGRSIRFDTLAVVRPGKGHIDFSDVSSWDATLRMPLAP